MCKGAKVENESMEYGVSSMGRDIDTGGSPGWRVAEKNFGSQVSAVRSRVRVAGFRYRYGPADDRAGHPYL